MKKVASMLLALALLVSPMKSAFAENKIYTAIKGTAEKVEDGVAKWVSENKERVFFILAFLFLGGYTYDLRVRYREIDEERRHLMQQVTTYTATIQSHAATIQSHTAAILALTSQRQPDHQ
jgi:hypothetical protein